MTLKTLKRSIVVAVRRAISIDEDEIRDQLADGLRRDHDALAEMVQRQGQALNNHKLHIEDLNARLVWYEKHIPIIAKERKRLEANVRKQAKVRAAAEELARPPEEEGVKVPEMAVEG